MDFVDKKFQFNGLLIFLIFLTILLSSVVFIVNYFFFKYHGNNYFPQDAFFIGLILLLLYYGLRILKDKQSNYFVYLGDFTWYYLVFVIIALATNAAQLTPFTPIDRQILKFEQYFGINTLNIIIWTKQYSWLEDILSFAYCFLIFQMVILPICAIFLSHRKELYEYYILMLITAILGFSIYYFYPTTAPASVLPNEYFNDYQIATNLKFSQIHHYTIPTTIEGGLIALPSFHVIWAWLSLYLVRKAQLLFVIFTPVNILIVLSCVMLGWHYLIDVIASIVLLASAHCIKFLVLEKRLFNRESF